MMRLVNCTTAALAKKSVVCLFALIILIPCHASGYDKADDLIGLDMKKENHAYIIKLPEGKSVSLVRSGCAVHRLDSGKRILLGSLYDGDEKEECGNNPGTAGYSVLIGDINYDGKPEFFIKKEATMADAYYSLVNSDRKDITAKMFDLSAFHEDDKKWINYPGFNKKKRQITCSQKDGPAHEFYMFVYNGNKYALHERMLPFLKSCSDYGVALMTREKFHEGAVTKTVVEAWSPFSDDKEVTGITLTNLQLFKNGKNGSMPIATIPKGTKVRVVDLNGDNYDDTETFWIKIDDGNKAGWTNDICHIKF